MPIPLLDPVAVDRVTRQRARRREAPRVAVLNLAAIALLPRLMLSQGALPWENAVDVLRAAFTGPIARGLSLVAIMASRCTAPTAAPWRGPPAAVAPRPSTPISSQDCSPYERSCPHHRPGTAGLLASPSPVPQPGPAPQRVLLRRQYSAFSGIEDGAAHRFRPGPRRRRLATCERFDRYAQLIRLSSGLLYDAIGEPHSRLQRAADPAPPFPPPSLITRAARMCQRRLGQAAVHEPDAATRERVLAYFAARRRFSCASSGRSPSRNGSNSGAIWSATRATTTNGGTPSGAWTAHRFHPRPQLTNDADVPPACSSCPPCPIRYPFVAPVREAA